MKPEDFLVVARELSRPQDASEGALRSATSRAYYAAYNTLVQDLTPKVGPVPISGPHTHLIHWLRNAKVDGADDVADSLEDLRDRRVEADYHLDRSTPRHGTVMLHVALAESIIREFRALARPALYEGVSA